MKKEYKGNGFTLIRTLQCKNLVNVQQCFTLIELLIAVAIVGVISVASVNLLFTTVLNRARQNSIQYASSDARNLIEIISKSIKQSTNVEASGSQLKITATTCRTLHLEGNSVLMATISTPSCVPPSASSGDLKMTDVDTIITSFVVAKIGDSISLLIAGNHKDAFGKHDFSYDTVITKRTN